MKFWNELSETQQLLIVILLFILMCIINPFIN